ncbi:unnamed protein product [Rotaria sp. Silwood1]|nr:unnamed protein product [Rotaria sp. Silwood1]CAF1028678.1 unnamed protein product [Rotaria sp. Silwood1]CAF1036536.1 unnamed protein product [Rotaria sp. Silwood1]CAF3389677.1 unnamed protein product [Rotaria sp. Silwood1]CAF3422037.1 unnamed protein product [Rotaria sp. Silwood1]
MSILARSLYAYRFFEIVNRVCLIQSVSCLSDSTTTTGKDQTNTSNESLRSCDFEIFGAVQHVYFRQHTQQQATKLNLIGWVKNTEMNTVKGHMEGLKTNIDQMKIWLQTKGSPKSKITKAEFTNEKSITKLIGNTFDIKR